MAHDAIDPDLGACGSRKQCVPLDPGLQELAQTFASRCAEQGLRRAFFDDRAVIDEHHTAGNLRGKSHFVRDDHHCHAFGNQRADDLKHLAHEFWIERGGWLVEQDHRRINRQCTGDAHPLLLSTGELARIGGQLVRKSNLGEHGAPDPACLVAAFPLH